MGDQTRVGLYDERSGELKWEKISRPISFSRVAGSSEDYVALGIMQSILNTLWMPRINE
jgi:hypothetical protein